MHCQDPPSNVYGCVVRSSPYIHRSDTFKRVRTVSDQQLFHSTNGSSTNHTQPSSTHSTVSSYRRSSYVPPSSSSRRSSSFSSSHRDSKYDAPSRQQHTIVASSCGHPIRKSSRLCWAGSEYDFDQLYCNDCERSNRIRDTKREAERDYETAKSRHENKMIREAEYKEARRTYDRARLPYMRDQEEQEERDDRRRRTQGRRTVGEEARAFSGLDDPAWLELKRSAGIGQKSARFDEPEEGYRRESRYRERPTYRRSSSVYEPGDYADRSGHGYWDTCKPERNDRRERMRTRSPTRARSISRARSPPRASSPPAARRRSRAASRCYNGEGENEYQSYLDTLSMDEIEDRQRRLRERLARFS